MKQSQEVINVKVNKMKVTQDCVECFIAYCANNSACFTGKNATYVYLKTWQSFQSVSPKIFIIAHMILLTKNLANGLHTWSKNDQSGVSHKTEQL